MQKRDFLKTNFQTGEFCFLAEMTYCEVLVKVLKYSL